MQRPALPCPVSHPGTPFGFKVATSIDEAVGLRLGRERMRRNLDLTRGLIVSERVMLALGEHVGRQHAHDLVYEAAQRAHAVGTSFATELQEMSEVAANLTPEQLAELLDPSRYVGLSAAFARDGGRRGAGRRRPACACGAGCAAAAGTAGAAPR